MINTEYLKFNVLTKPEKDLFKAIQSNAKFKTLSDVIRTKVGINNFYNFSITIQSSILMRDIILNSQYVSGWARSSQVLNDNDSKFSVYKFLTRTREDTMSWINTMEQLEATGHSMDNMRALIYLDSVNDYAISIDILHLIYLALVLADLYDSLSDNEDLKAETKYFLDSISTLLIEYDVNYSDFKQMIVDAHKDFPAINLNNKLDFKSLTYEEVYKVSATYSVIGQIWRHRTLVKTYDATTYSQLVDKTKNATFAYDYSLIGMHSDIALLVKDFTSKATNAYDLCQGSIVPFQFSGTVAAIHKALCQRTCFINDSPQFKDAFKLFEDKYPEMTLLPPCKLNTTNTNNCYVSYVNESRRRGEEKTQVVCPIYAKSKNYVDDYDKTMKNSKTNWYIDNFKMWKKVCS